MNLIVLQPFGIGDVIFTQTLIHQFMNGGYNNVLWPVMPQFTDGLNKAYPDIHFIDKNLVNIDFNCREDKMINNTTRQIPLRWNVELLKVPYSSCMETKYSLYGFDYKIWKDNAMFQRNKFKEQLLFEKLNISKDTRYNLINRFFGSDSQFVAPIRVDNGLPNIEMCSLANYSLFEWAGIIEHAENIHTVSTSLLYLLEILDLKSEKIHLYPRKPIEQDFRNVEYLLTKQYEYHL